MHTRVVVGHRLNLYVMLLTTAMWIKKWKLFGEHKKDTIYVDE